MLKIILDLLSTKIQLAVVLIIYLFFWLSVLMTYFIVQRMFVQNLITNSIINNYKCNNTISNSQLNSKSIEIEVKQYFKNTDGFSAERIFLKLKNFLRSCHVGIIKLLVRLFSKLVLRLDFCRRLLMVAHYKNTNKTFA